MPSNIPVPSVSTDGWIKTVPARADRLLAYFFVSEDSQSNNFQGQIASLPACVQRSGNSQLGFQSDLENTLAKYLQPQFDVVTIDVQVTAVDTKIPGRMDASVVIDVIDDGISYNFSSVVQILNSKIVKIINANNNG